MTAILEFQKYSEKYNRKCNARRRIVILQKRVLFTAITLTLICICVLLGSSFSAAAKGNSKDTGKVYKYYTSIQVETGDSLWSIAELYAASEYCNYEEYIEEVITLNNISDETIHAGQYLMIPYYSYDYK